MKTLVKLTLAFVLGISVTTAVILPKASQTTAESPAITPAANLEAQIQTAADEAVNLALTKTESTAEPSPEPQKEAEEITAAPETTPAPEPAKVEVKAEIAPKPTSSPQVNQPETWWEDGKQYTMINGHKAEISPEGNNQLSYYDWESDPLKDVPGPFNGNGGN